MKISVVIPIYNKAAYCGNCLESILQQQFDDFEVICVDDGSTDDSGSICDQWAQKDARVIAIHTENSGVTAARRRGVAAAKGKYILFADADDKLPPHAIQTLYDAIVQQQADEVIGTFQLTDGTPSPVAYKGFVPAEQLAKDIITNKNRFPVLWGIIFHHSILEGCLDIPRDIIEGEDKLTQLHVLMKNPKVYVISDCVYIYTPGLPNNRRWTKERQRHYDRLLCDILASQWSVYRTAYYIRRIKDFLRVVAPWLFRLR